MKAHNPLDPRTPYRKADYDPDQWPIHVVYDELREEQVEGFIHPLGFDRKSRRAILATARQRARQGRDPQDLRHRRGTQAGRLLTKAARGLTDDRPRCFHERTTAHGRRDNGTRCVGP